MELLSLFLADRAPLLLLAFARMVGLTMTYPVFAAPWVPPVVRVSLAFGLSGLVLPLLGPGSVPAGPQLWPLLLGEVLVGMAAGFTGQLLFAAAEAAGALVDLDLGYGLAQVFDPIAGANTAVIARLYRLLAVFLFFLLDGHLAVVSAVVGNLHRTPPGGLTLGDSALLTLVTAFGAVLELAVELAMPAYAALFISTAVLAALARAAPSLNLFAVGFNVKIPVGLALLVLALPYTGQMLQRLIADAQFLLERVLVLMQ